jgi:dephospho-CoA kinase
MMSQYIVGITGTIGSGKSYVSQRFVELGQKYNIPVHDIDLDHIGHYIL